MPSQNPDLFSKAVRLLSGSTHDGGVYGLAGSASSFIVAAAVRDRASTLVVIDPEGEGAARRTADIRFYLGEEGRKSDSLRDPVVLYPSSDVLPYALAGLEADIWNARTSALYRLCQSGAPRVIAVGLDALIRKVVPKSVIRQASFSLSVGQEIDRDLLFEQLVWAGYSRSPLVEDAGDFSVRGFIIDLYPPFYSYPVRIEQMGDEIESIRFFDPSTQRSRESVPEIEVGPIHMLIPDDEAKEAGLQRLLEACEQRGIEKRVRQRLMDDFHHRLRFPGADQFLPFFFPNLESPLDYLPPDATLIIPDNDTVSRELEEIEEEIFRGWETAAEEGLPVPGPEDLYLTRGELFEKLGKFRTVIDSSLEMEDDTRVSRRLDCVPNTDLRSELLKGTAYDTGMARLVKHLEDWRDDGYEVFVVSHTRSQAIRLLKLLEPYSVNIDFRGEGFDQANLDPEPVPGIRLYIGELSSGFRMECARRVVITEEEIFGSRVRAVPRTRARGTLVSSFADLTEGEPVVHEDYGIGIFRGLTKKDFDGVSGEVMVIEFAGGDLLYHPLERLQVIQKYVSGSEAPPRIDRLGGKGWIKTKKKVQQSIREMAHELLKIYAKREVSRRRSYSPPDEHFSAFEASFEFEETPDQAKAIQDVMECLDTDKPMDHLVCGDVGYGKTEVALRAAFRVVMDGKQVAVLVPTTVLALQHYHTFKERFKDYPVEVDVLSRFRSPADQKEIIERLNKGQVDVVIGTHKLLQKDIAFPSLGLLVVDEEHRFGVTHKERIKKFKAHVDVLTLTATPIPRTLNLSLSGIRDLSVIETPPVNRKAIRTHVMRQSDEVIREALLRELRRGGQVFYVHNRVRTIFRRAASLRELVPEGTFGVAHGQMGNKELEHVMTEFVSGAFNVLVCTSIIESGLDIPRANTIIIERADTFGLADLYQLRGRVGRSHTKAHAYLITPPESLMTADAIKRLAVIQEHSSLGQGFKIAMRDMEIRGAGNILGTSQSGHVVLVGYEMYLELLEQAVQEMKGARPVPKINPEIRLKTEAMIPEEYVPDPRQRMSLYKRLSQAHNDREIDEVQDEMHDLYGRPSVEVDRVVRMMKIRVAMKQIRIIKLDYNDRDLVVGFHPETPVDPARLIAWANSHPEKVRLLPGDKLTYTIGNVDPDDRIAHARDLMKSLAQAVPEPSAEAKIGSGQTTA